MAVKVKDTYILYFFLLVFTIIFGTDASNCKGCVQLDSYSFDKVIAKFKSSLVKFDVAYPYGEKHDEYIKLAEAVHNVNELLIAEVPVKDYGDKDNSDLAERFGVNKDDFPVLKLFIGGKEAATYSGDFKADDVKKFVKSKSGVYIGLPGCSEEFDKLATQFVKESNSDKRKNILRKSEDLWDKAEGKTSQKNAEVYVKTMRKIIEVGNEFTEKEIARVENILKGKISKEKKNELETRVNILQSFKTVVKDEL